MTDWQSVTQTHRHTDTQTHTQTHTHTQTQTHTHTHTPTHTHFVLTREELNFCFAFLWWGHYNLRHNSESRIPSFWFSTTARSNLSILSSEIARPLLPFQRFTVHKLRIHVCLHNMKMRKTDMGERQGETEMDRQTDRQTDRQNGRGHQTSEHVNLLGIDTSIKFSHNSFGDIFRSS